MRATCRPRARHGLPERGRPGDRRGRSHPRQPLPGTREAWPQRVSWLSRLSGGRQARPPQLRTLRLNAPQRPLRRARAPRRSRLGLPSLGARSGRHRHGRCRPLGWIAGEAASRARCGAALAAWRPPNSSKTSGPGSAGLERLAQPRMTLRARSLSRGVRAATTTSTDRPLLPSACQSPRCRRALGPERGHGLVAGVGLATRGSNCFVTISMSLSPEHGVGKSRKYVGNRPFPTSLRTNGMRESRSGYPPPVALRRELRGTGSGRSTPSSRASVKLPLQRLHARNGGGRFTGKSTCRKRPNVSRSVRTFQKASGPSDTAASGLSSASPQGLVGEPLGVRPARLPRWTCRSMPFRRRPICGSAIGHGRG